MTPGRGHPWPCELHSGAIGNAPSIPSRLVASRKGRICQASHCQPMRHTQPRSFETLRRLDDSHLCFVSRSYVALGIVDRTTYLV